MSHRPLLTICRFGFLSLLISAIVGCVQQLEPEKAIWPKRLNGICDTSAAVLTSDGGFILASDEHNHLFYYDLDQDIATPILPSIASMVLGAGVNLDRTKKKGHIKEIDIEAVAKIEIGGNKDVAFWIGSHGRAKAKLKKGQVRAAASLKNRHLLFATNIPKKGQRISLQGKPATSLRAVFLNPPEEFRETLAPLKKAEPLWANAGGWNIEGMAGSHTKGELVLGFRSPVDSEKRALLISLANAKGIVEGESPRISKASWIDLGKRGIRSLSWSNHHKTWFILAGPVGMVDATKPSLPDLPGYAHDFALFSWDGRTAKLLRRFAGSMRFEGMIVTNEGCYLLSDDGKVLQADGKTCAEHMESQNGIHSSAFSRALFVPLPPAK